MDYQVLFNIVLAALGALVMVLITLLHKKIDRLTEEDRDLLLKVSALQILVAGHYVTRTEFDTKFDALIATFSKKLDSIDDKLDRRARV